jgi:DNA-binding transcriptional MerR regulator
MPDTIHATSTNQISIRDAAEKLNVSIKTLRRWEEHGLVHPTRNDLNQRVYSTIEIDNLNNRKYKPLPEAAITPQNYLSISQAADEVGVSVKTLRRWDAEGKIQLTRDQLNRRVFTKDTVDFIKKNRTQFYQSPEDKTDLNAKILTKPQENLLKPRIPTFVAPLLSILPFLLVIAPIVLFTLLGFKPSLPLQSIDLITSKPVSVNQLNPEFTEGQPLITASESGNPLLSRVNTGQVAGVTTSGGSLLSFENILDNNYNLGVAGLIEGNQLVSTTTVKAPLIVASKELVTNLNADLLDGHSWEEIEAVAIEPAGLQKSYEAGNTIVTTTENLDITLSGSTQFVVGGTGGLNFKTTGQTTFVGNVDATDGLDVTGAPLTVGNSKITMSSETGNITTEGDVAINGGDLTTSATTFNLLNTTATTINLGGAASNLYLGSSSGTTTVNGTLTVSNAFNANGTVTLGDSGDTITMNASNAVFNATSTISVRPSSDSDDYIYFSTSNNEPGLFFAGTSTSYDPGIRVNSSTGQIEFRDQNSSTWQGIGTGSSWTDGGTYLTPTNHESVRVTDASGNYYINVQHDGTNVLITNSGTSQVRLDTTLNLTGTASLMLPGNNTLSGSTGFARLNQSLQVDQAATIGGTLAIGSLAATTDNNRLLTYNASTGVVGYLDISTWDKNWTDDVDTASIGATIQAYNANTSLLGQTIEESELNITNSPSNGFLLQTDDSGNLTWIDPSTLGTASGDGYFTLGAQQLHPINTSLDLVLGGTGTASSSIALQAGTGNIKSTTADIGSFRLSGTTLGLASDTDLLSLSSMALTVNGTLEVASSITAPTIGTINNLNINNAAVSNIASLSFQTANNSWDSSGNVSISNNLVASHLYTRDSDQTNNLQIRWNENDTADRILDIYLANANRQLVLNENFTIGDGTPGILTYTNASTLTVEANAYINQDLTTDANPSFAGATINGVNLNNYTSYFIDSAGNNGQVWTSDGTGAGHWAEAPSSNGGFLQLNSEQLAPANLAYDILIGGTSTASAKIALQTNGTITTTGDILPATDNTQNLGSSTNRWKSLFVGPGTIHLGENGNQAAISYDSAQHAIQFDTDSNGTVDFTITNGGGMQVGTILTQGNTIGLTSDSDLLTIANQLLTINGDVNATGSYQLNGNNVSQYFIDSAGSSGYVWTSNGSSRGSWQDPLTLTASNNYWQLNNEQISAKNALWDDIMVGGSTTASATIALQAHTGNVTATSAHLNNLYLTNTQVTATATELNLLSGHINPLLDTGNIGSTVQAYNANTSVLGQTIDESELNITNSPTNGYLLQTDGSGNMTWVDPGTFGGTTYTGSNGITLVGSDFQLSPTYFSTWDMNHWDDITTANMATQAASLLSGWDQNASDDLTTGTTFAGQVKGAYNTLQLNTTNGYTNGYVLQTDGSGNLTWVDPNIAGAATNYWLQTNEQIYAKNALWNDLLIGGTSTAAAKIALQANTGNINAVSFNNTISATELGLLDGRSGTLLDTNNITAQLSSWDQNAADDYINPMTTAGDLVYGGTAGAATRLAGSATDGFVLKYNTSTNAPYWAAESTDVNYFQLNNTTEVSPNNLAYDILLGGTTTASAKIALQAGTGNIVTTGTISGATWNGPTITSQYGGTGANNNTAAQYSIPYYSSTGVLGGVLTPGSAGYVLTTNSTTGAPTWTDTGTMGTNYWQLNSQQLSSKNALWNDLLVGGTTTASATIALQANTGHIAATSLTLGASTTANSQLILTSSAGTNPSSPTAGSLWFNGASLNFYDGVVTKDLLSTTGLIEDPTTTAGDTIYRNNSATAQNVALTGFGATATSSNYDTGTPGSVIDGNDATRWGGDGGAGPWLRIDLGQPRKIVSWRMLQSWADQREAAQQVQVYGSNDDSSYTLIATTNMTVGDQTTSFNSSQYYRYFKFVRSIGGSWGWQVYTIEVQQAAPTFTRLAIGSEGQVMTVTSGVPSWTTLPNYWQMNNEQISAKNALWSDLMIGGTSTASAKISLQANTGNINAVSFNNTISATELGLLDGRSGTLLDTGNVAVQLASWDQNASDDITTSNFVSSAVSFLPNWSQNKWENITFSNLATASATTLSTWDQNSFDDVTAASIGATVQAYNANTSLLGQTIDGTELRLGSDTAGDTMYFDGSNWVRLAGSASDGYVLKYNTTTHAPYWAAEAGGTNYFQLNNTTEVAPANPAYDLLIGGTSTASAKIALASTGAFTLNDIVKSAGVNNKSLTMSADHTKIISTGFGNPTKYYSTGTNPFFVATGDVNNDGYADIAVANSGSTSVSVYINNKDGTFAAKVDYTTGTTPRSVAIGDVNNDGYADMAVANGGSTSVSVFINNKDGTFAAKVDYTTGTSPYSVSIGDINNDGYADLAVANSGSTTVSVFINNKNSTFAAKVDYTTGSSPYSVAIGDVNNDGYADMAVANSSSTSVSIFINNKNGTFAAKVDYTAGTNPYSVSIGDINNDGYADMAVANYNSTSVSVFINNKDGTFATKVDYATGTNPRSITIGDVNNDGYADLAVANSASTSVSVFINNKNGTFAPKIDYAAIASPYAVATKDLNNDGFGDIVTVSYSGNQLIVFTNNKDGTFSTKTDYAASAGPHTITAGDVNNDGYADLAVANATTNTVSIFINNKNGTFAAKVDYTTGTNPFSIAIGDINNDGFADMAVTNADGASVSVFINNKDGTFTTKVDYTTGTDPRYIAIGDVNNDGYADMAVTNFSANTISVFINNKDGTFAARVNYTTGGSPIGVAIADVDNDGYNDLAVTNYSSTSVSVFINNKNGTFAAKVDYTTGSSPHYVAAGDVNNDGYADLVIPNTNSNTVSVLINNKNGTFAAKVDYATGINPYSVSIGDINNDGYADLAVANYFSNSVSTLMNNKDGTFSTKSDYAAGVSTFHAILTDLNNDGYPDIAAVNYGTNTLSVFLNGAYGNEMQGDLVLAGRLVGTSNLSFVTNNNTRMTIDLSGNVGIGTTTPTAKLAVSGSFTLNDVVKSYGQNANSLAMSADHTKITNTGFGNPLGEYTTGTNPYSVAIGDINNDGYADLAVANSGSTSVSVFINNKNGTFAAKVDYTTGSNPRSVAIGDVNNDGYMDLAVANSGSTSVSVFINNKNGTFAAKVDYTTGSNPRSVAIGDVNNDGYMDLAVANYGSTSVSVFINNKNGTFAAKVDYTTGTNPNSVAIGDINNDGYADLAVANYGSTSVSVFINNKNGTFAAKVDYTTGTNPNSVAIGDINNDGYADLAVANYGSTSVSVFINNKDSTFAAKVDYTTGTHPGSVAFGDVNKDGYLDMAVTNSNSTTVSVFINNKNGTFAAKVDYAGSSPTSVAIGDINNDGYIDLAVANYSSTSVSVFINNKDGTFAAKVDYTTGSSPYSVAIGDVNNDGYMDLAVANSSSTSVSVFINNKNGTFAAKVDYTTGSVPTSVAIGDINNDGYADMAVANSSSTSVSIFINNKNGTFAAKVDYTTGSSPYSVAIGDVNNDGYMDLAVTNSGSTSVSVFINNKDSTFAAKVDYTTGSSPRSVAIGDVNKDGYMDLAVTNLDSTTVSVFINNKNGTFAAKVDYTTGTNPNSVAIGDINNDGYADMAVANYGSTSVSVFINNKNGTFIAKVDYTTGSSPRSVAIGDINNDGYADMAVTNYSSASVSIFINNKDSTFAAKVDYTTGTNPYSVAIGDVNKDGFMDLAVVNYGSTSVSVLINGANGTEIQGDLVVNGRMTGTSTLNFATNNTSRMLIDSLGNIGIGTTSAATRLDIQGGYGGRATAIINQTNTTSDIFTASSSGTTRMTITNAGNVGIGTALPAVNLHVASTSDADIFELQDSDGTCTANPEAGAVTWTCSSDRRLKSNITDAAGVLDNLMKLQIRDYTVNASGDLMTGLIAQEVQQVMPELVSTGEDGYLRVTEVSSWKLIKAIQELNDKISSIFTSLTTKSVTTDNLTVNGKSINTIVADEVNQQLARYTPPSTSSDTLAHLSSLDDGVATVAGAVDYHAEEIASTSNRIDTLSANYDQKTATLESNIALIATDSASISARVAALESQTTQTETVSRIDALESQLASISSQLQSYELQTKNHESDLSLTATESALATEIASPATSSAEMTSPLQDLNLDVESAFISDFLSVMGDTILTNATVTTNLTVSTINTATGNLSLVGSLLTLDATGNAVTINGNLNVTGLASLNTLTTQSATISGTLSAPIIDELTTKLASLSAQLTDLAIQRSNDQATMASLSAQIASLSANLATPSAATSTPSAVQAVSTRLLKLGK